jgi:hypothetical protein
MDAVAGFIDRVLSAGVRGVDELARETEAVRAEVAALCAKFPLPGHG